MRLLITRGYVYVPNTALALGTPPKDFPRLPVGTVRRGSSHTHTTQIREVRALLHFPLLDFPRLPVGTVRRGSSHTHTMQIREVRALLHFPLLASKTNRAEHSA
ncbi:hypothetical protein JTE90_004864 [Oedothorax gibbosus]|uniref:Uncharacterized protein n=1 Tax=Oedothorax gibbosus TaxID=931172 RepID=A0AAV6UU06_9ARAC|nr:hypothetical protein JTE90_004864 [Oedothorax gibbosus]